MSTEETYGGGFFKDWLKRRNDAINARRLDSTFCETLNEYTTKRNQGYLWKTRYLEPGNIPKIGDGRWFPDAKREGVENLYRVNNWRLDSEHWSDQKSNRVRLEYVPDSLWRSVDFTRKRLMAM